MEFGGYLLRLFSDKRLNWLSKIKLISVLFIPLASTDWPRSGEGLLCVPNSYGKIYSFKNSGTS